MWPVTLAHDDENAMIQRIYLIPDAEGAQAFDESRLRNAIKRLASVDIFIEGQATADPVGTLFECDISPVQPDHIRVPIEVRSNLSSISIGAFDDAGLSAAIEFQRLYGREVFAFSEESSPDVAPLSTVKDATELAAVLKLSGSQ
jgi:hypothetical protein